jgi:mannose-6-phosphate isomerase
LETKLELSELDKLIVKLMHQYPNDNGIFAPILMNFIKLQKGQSFYIGANELHAYISGDCIECMALSDNVVRAGLTPKHKDVLTLSTMLTYR